MTQDYVMQAMLMYELTDAKEALQAALDLFKPSQEVDEDEFQRHGAHLYSHVNSAWNMRDLPHEQFESADDETMDS